MSCHAGEQNRMSLQFFSANTFFPPVPSVTSETPSNTAARLILVMRCPRRYLLGIFAPRPVLRTRAASRSALRRPRTALGPARPCRRRGLRTHLRSRAQPRSADPPWPSRRPRPRRQDPATPGEPLTPRAGGAARGQPRSCGGAAGARSQAGRGSRSHRASHPTPAPGGRGSADLRAPARGRRCP